MLFRVFCTIFLLISVCALPLFFTIAMGLFCVVWFEGYYELIPLYFLNDVLYGAKLLQYHSFGYVMTLSAVILVGVSIFIRKHLFNGGSRSRYI